MVLKIFEFLLSRETLFVLRLLIAERGANNQVNFSYEIKVYLLNIYKTAEQLKQFNLFTNPSKTVVKKLF